jgi:hypothetical protein
MRERFIVWIGKPHARAGGYTWAMNKLEAEQAAKRLFALSPKEKKDVIALLGKADALPEGFLRDSFEAAVAGILETEEEPAAIQS